MGVNLKFTASLQTYTLPVSFKQLNYQICVLSHYGQSSIGTIQFDPINKIGLKKASSFQYEADYANYGSAIIVGY